MKVRGLIYLALLFLVGCGGISNPRLVTALGPAQKMDVPIVCSLEESQLCWERAQI